MRKFVISISTVCLFILISVANGSLPNKIFGGDVVEISKYPHQVSVQFQNEHFCGGVIISLHHILTAASCLLNDDYVFYANIQVFSGSDTLIPSTYNRNWQIHHVSFVIFHKNYNPRTHWVNDIAILKLSSEMRLSFECKPIRMPSTHMSTRRHITGWGRDPNTGIINNSLQRLWVSSTPALACKKKYQVQETLYPSQYCLTPKSATAQVTAGNAGSPVAGGTVLAGIISLINFDRNYPVIYTYAAPYYEWIERMKRDY